MASSRARRRDRPTRSRPRRAGASFHDFLLAVVAGLFAYGGWHMVTYTAGETRMPARTIPVALVAGVGIVTVCYVALNLVYLRILPLDAVRSSTRVAADAADAVLGRGGSAVLAALVMVSSIGGLTGIVLTGPRVYFSMAQDGLAPRWLGYVHPVYRTPSHAIVAQAVWASVLAATGAYRQLFTRVIYTEWLFFALMAAGLFVLRRRPDYQPAVPHVGLSGRAAGLHRRVARDRGQPVRQHAGGGGRRASGWSRSARRSTICGMRIVDFHNHYYPPEYVEALMTLGVRRSRSPTTTTANPCVHYPGDYNILVPGHRDIEYRQRVLDEHGVDTQVLSFTTPGVHVEPPADAVRLARADQRRLRARRAGHGKGRFAALATLPLNDPAASVRELERAMKELGLPGAMVFSNVNHVALADERFAPLWKKADELGAVIYIHPTDPLGVEAMLDYWLMPLVGFLMDTTLAASKLVFSGVVERHPRIRWVLTHMGGAIPYLAERLDRGYRAFADCRQHIDRPPSEYLKTFYYDTVNFNPDAVRLAISFAGADRILAGSDYPAPDRQHPADDRDDSRARRQRRRQEEDLRGERGGGCWAVGQRFPGSSGFAPGSSEFRSS